MTTMTISDGYYSGQATVACEYHPGLVGIFRKQPGCLWNPSTYTTSVPDELLSEIITEAKRLRITINDIRSSPITYTPPLYVMPWQAEAITKALHDRTLLVGFDTGLGKSLVALEVARIVGGNTLIVCPASVRNTWLAEIQRWNPDALPFSRIIRKDSTPDIGINVTSYEYLRAHLETFLDFTWDTIIYDEIHYLKNGYKTDRSEAALQISKANPRAYKLGLSATSITNEAQDIWHLLHVLSPNRFSSWYKFIHHYCIVSENQWGGIEVQGLNPEHTAELQQRISAQSIFKSKAELREYLPKLAISIDWHSPDIQTPKVITSEYLLQHTEKSAPHKVRIVLDKMSEPVTERTCILTHLIDTAKQIHDGLPSSYLIEGGVPHNKREKILAACLQEPESILVATMHSIGVGLNSLTMFKRIIFAELYWSPAIVVQALGRFVRMYSPPGDVRVSIIALRGTVDEPIALALQSKIEAASALIEIGQESIALATELGALQDEFSFVKSLRNQLESGCWLEIY